VGLNIHVRDEVGAVVAHAPGIPGVAPERVSLRRVAEKLIAKGKIPPLSAAQLAELDHMGGVEVGGKIAKKLKAKVAAPIKKAAKAVATSKVVKSVAKVAAKVVPAPASYAITGAQAAAKLGKALKKGDPKAKKIAPMVKLAAQGKATAKQLTDAAKKVGVDATLALEAAAVGKVAMMAEQGDPQAQAAMNVANQLTSPNVQDQEQAAETIGQLAVVQAAQSGDATAFMVTAPDGTQYKTLVVPATSA
jgi:hypothetical protein